MLDPVKTWKSASEYEAAAKKLAAMFVENFKKYEPHVSDKVTASMPVPDGTAVTA